MKNKVTRLEQQADNMWHQWNVQSDKVFWKKYNVLIQKSKKQIHKRDFLQPSTQPFSKAQKKSANLKRVQEYTFYPYRAYLLSKLLSSVLFAAVPAIIIYNLEFPKHFPWLIAIIIVFGSGLAFYLSSITSFKITQHHFLFIRTFFFDKSVILLQDIRDMFIIRQSRLDESGELHFYNELFVQTSKKNYRFQYDLKNKTHKRFKKILSRKHIKLDDQKYRHY